MPKVVLRHEWVIDYIGGRPALGPNTLRATERTLTLLADLGLDAATELTIVQSVNTYVLGAVLREFHRGRRLAAGGRHRGTANRGAVRTAAPEVI